MKSTFAPAAIELHNILFATDFSPAAVAALPFAVHLAEEFGAKLYAVHAKAPENYALPTTEIWPIVNAQLEKESGDFKRALREDYPALDSEVIIMEGGVIGVVEAVADAKHADLIILGTSGRRGIGKFILGSVAEEILRRAACPVLTVGPHVAPGAQRDKKFHKILYATEFSEGAPSAAAFAIGLAQEQQARLALLHVIEHPRPGDLVRPHELESLAFEHLASYVTGEPGLLFEPKTIVAHGAPAEKILEVAAREQADLIVLGLRHAKGFIRATHLPNAVAHQVISQATCPVVTVRA
jgi:nucleotide-binding universal stress UspA family protein